METATETEVESVNKNVQRVKDAHARRDRNWEVIRETMDSLIGATDNDDLQEYDILGKIAVRAGLMWRCVDQDCAALNHLNCQRCDVCNSRRPKDREVPKADNWA